VLVGSPASVVDTSADAVTDAALEAEGATDTVASIDGERLELSRREFDLLDAFMANAGIVMSRVRLLELVWGYDFEVDTNVVDVFVGYLRRKLQAAGHGGLIQTVRGVGFVLRVR
jgi:two-component system response regulator PrrA